MSREAAKEILRFPFVSSSLRVTSHFGIQAFGHSDLIRISGMRFSSFASV
jgi:hypothetical protein